MDFLRNVETFVRVIDAGNLSRAARALRRSLPTVSRAIDALERELGAELLVRTTRRVEPTEAGRVFLVHARRLVHEADEARSSVTMGREARGTVVVSASVTLGLVHVIPMLKRLAKKHPELVVELRLDDRITDFLAEGVDVAVSAGIPLGDRSDVIARALSVLPLWLVASPALVDRRGTPKRPEALAKWPALVGSGGGDAGLVELVRGDERARVEVRPRLRAVSPIARRDAAIEGLGFALLPTSIVRTALEERRLVRLLEPWSAPGVTAYAIYRRESRELPRVRAFVSELEASMRESEPR